MINNLNKNYQENKVNRMQGSSIKNLISSKHYKSMNDIRLLSHPKFEKELSALPLFKKNFNSYSSLEKSSSSHVFMI